MRSVGFFGLFLVGLWTINFYVIYRISSLFGYTNKLVIGLISLVMWVFIMGSFSLNRIYDNVFLNIAYELVNIWLGMVVIALGVLAIFEIINIFLDIKNVYVGGFVLFMILSSVGYSIINASKLKIKTIDVQMRGLDHNIKAVYMSDVHINNINSESFVPKLIKTINEINPDVIFINGDFIDSISLTHHNFKDINTINAPIFMTLGNHEEYVGVTRVYDMLSGTKVKILRNEMVEFSGMQIIGLDYVHGFDNTDSSDQVKSVLSKVSFDSAKPNILLLHSPVGYDVASSMGIDLQFAGHTHNGQFWPFSWIVRYFFPKTKGMYDVGDMKLFTSSGAGTWGPPMRLDSDSEIIIVNLNKS